MFNSWLALAFETAQLGLARLRRMIVRRQGPPCAIRLKPSPVHNPGLKRSFWVRGKIDTVAAMNKSLARTNKSQDGGKSAPAGDDGGALLLLPP